MNIELIEMIAKGRGAPVRKDTNVPAAQGGMHGISPIKIPAASGPIIKFGQSPKSPRSGNLNNSSEMSINRENSRYDLKNSNTIQELEMEEEEYLNKIVTDNTFMVDENREAKNFRRQKSMLSNLSELNTKDYEDGEQTNHDKMRDLERARQEAIYTLFNQVVLDKLVRKNDDGKMTDIQDYSEVLVDMKLESIRGFKTLQHLRIPPKNLTDHGVLEELLKDKLKKDYQEQRYKSLTGKSKSDQTPSLPAINVTSANPLPQSRLMDLDRRNKLISTHQSLIIQIKQATKYLNSSRSKLNVLKDTYMKLYEGYKIKKEQLVEEIKKINKKIKKLATKKYQIAKNEEKEKDALNETLKDIGPDGNRSPGETMSPENLVGRSLLIDFDGNSRASFQNYTQQEEDEDSVEIEQAISKSYGRKSIMGPQISQRGSTSSLMNNENAITLILGDLRRSKTMKQKELADLVEHEKENLGIKKDYLDSLTKYVLTLEDSLTKTQRKLRNMYLFLLEHPRDIR